MFAVTAARFDAYDAVLDKATERSGPIVPLSRTQPTNSRSRSGLDSGRGWLCWPWQRAKSVQEAAATA